MLILDAEIKFDLPTENKDALGHDLSTNILLRPVIGFGEGYGHFFSGELIVDKSIKTIVRGISSRLMINMPTVNEEAYEWIRDLVKEGNFFTIRNGSRILGKGKIIDFIYEDKSNEINVPKSVLDDMDEQLRNLIDESKKIEAIAKFRLITGRGLKEAKEYVDNLI